jgi:hypothetical protein
LKNNIINLKNFRKNNSSYEEDMPELDDIIIIGWAENKIGERSLHIISEVGTVKSLWMIDIAKKIIDNNPSQCVDEDE